MKKNTISLNESDLHKIIAETINSVLSEAFNTNQYAYLSGAADKALADNKLKALTDPKWFKRKQRQAKLFGNAAAGHANRHNYSSINGHSLSNTGEEDYSYASEPNTSYTTNSITLDYNKDAQKKNKKVTGNDSPFVAQKRQYRPGYTKVGKETSWSASGTRGKEDGDVINPWDQDFIARNGMGMGKQQAELNRAYAEGAGKRQTKRTFQDIPAFDWRVDESVIDSVVNESIKKLLEEK